MWAPELRGQRQWRTCASVPSAAGARAEREGGRGSLRERRRSGGSWNSSCCCCCTVQLMPGTGSAASTPRWGRRCLTSKSPSGQWHCQEPGTAALFFSFPAKSTCLRTLLLLDWKVFFVISVSFLWKQVWDQEKITQSRVLKQVCREVVGFSVSFPFLAELRQWGAPVRIEFDLKYERWERQG